jgi:hypothetical protein
MISVGANLDNHQLSSSHIDLLVWAAGVAALLAVVVIAVAG